MSAQNQRDYWDGLAGAPIDASVIDPNDRLGAKNGYLAHIRNREITKALRPVDEAAIVLDLGCGTGSLSEALCVSGRSVVGMDISPGLLRRTGERLLGDQALFACYDGTRFPLVDDCVGAITTYVVFNHVIGAGQLQDLLRECHRVLEPGGYMVCIEQVRSSSHLDRRGWKLQRRREEFLSAFEQAGFSRASEETIRYGHFPTTFLVRLGLIPRAAFPLLAAMERAHGRLRPNPKRDYCDVLFTLVKPLR